MIQYEFIAYKYCSEISALKPSLAKCPDFAFVKTRRRQQVQRSASTPRVRPLVTKNINFILLKGTKTYEPISEAISNNDNCAFVEDSRDFLAAQNVCGGGGGWVCTWCKAILAYALRTALSMQSLRTIKYIAIVILQCFQCLWFGAKLFELGECARIQEFKNSKDSKNVISWTRQYNEIANRNLKRSEACASSALPTLLSCNCTGCGFFWDGPPPSLGGCLNWSSVIGGEAKRRRFVEAGG